MRKTFLLPFALIIPLLLPGCGTTPPPPAGGSKAPGIVDKAIAKALDLTPEPLTASDIAAVKFVNGKLPDAPVSYALALKIRPLLQADKNTTAFHLGASNRIDPTSGLVTKIESHKATSSLEIFWKDGIVKRLPGITTQTGGEFSEISDWQRLNGGGTSIHFGKMLPKRDVPCIGIANQEKDGEWKVLGQFPYDHLGYRGAPSFAFPKYPIGVLPKMYLGEPGGLASIIVVDIKNPKIIGEISPKELDHGNSPYFSLDNNNNVLLGVDFYLDWIILLDFREYLKTDATKPKEEVR